jgi:hypothetical protein
MRRTFSFPRAVEVQLIRSPHSQIKRGSEERDALVHITVVTLFEMSVRVRAVCSQLYDFIRRNARLRNGVFQKSEEVV